MTEFVTYAGLWLLLAAALGIVMGLILRRIR